MDQLLKVDFVELFGDVSLEDLSLESGPGTEIGLEVLDASGYVTSRGCVEQGVAITRDWDATGNRIEL